MTHSQELPSSGTQGTEYRGSFGPACSIGFGAAVLMWVVAWIIHMPGMEVPTPVGIALLFIPLAGMAFLWSRNVAKTNRIKVGVLSGLVAGLANLMILGSYITEQPETTAEMGEKANDLQPNAILVILGSIAVSIIVATVAAVIAKGKDSDIVGPRKWLSRLAWVTALTYLPLIAVGGAVTSTDAGLAVPDAVTSYGAISVLFPLELMAEPRIFLEHSHRLFGTLAGLTTLVLMARVLTSRVQMMPKILSAVLFVSVTAQGILGIIRVADESTAFAVIHGVFAQIVFGLAFVIAVMLTLTWVDANPSEEVRKIARKARTLCTLATISLLIQLVFGALTRHLHSSHAMMSHMGFAFIVMTLIIVGGALCIRAAKTDDTGKPIRIYGILMHGIVTWQFALGFATLGLAWESEKPELPTADTLSSAEQIEAIPALVATLHHVSGAMLLAMTVCALAWAFRLARGPKMR